MHKQLRKSDTALEAILMQAMNRGDATSYRHPGNWAQVGFGLLVIPLVIALVAVNAYLAWWDAD